MFDLHVAGTNGNVRDVGVDRVDLSLFAASVVPRNDTAPPALAQPAVFLGTVTQFNEPVVFPAGTLGHSRTTIVTAQVQLKSPGKADGPPAGSRGADPPPAEPTTPEETDAERWARIIRGPYDLTLRGTLRYALWFKLYVVRICFIQRVDPAQAAVGVWTIQECDKDEHPTT
ncbi:Vacuolar inheritance and morphology protein [Tieghemiomyces parasiticus]|uniref:Vacuolar inheritance and morphology protein n=1 Tax=Tieghemiomyces parasiticus TaxID=78921 RepID=A0A9W8DKG5_9FUNG|nr:Vacuolar inheritance and morphology protein [Tieghemiomyces parasiticus]